MVTPSTAVYDTRGPEGYAVREATLGWTEAATTALRALASRVQYVGASDQPFPDSYALWPTTEGVLAVHITDAGADAGGRPHAMKIAATWFPPNSDAAQIRAALGPHAENLQDAHDPCRRKFHGHHPNIRVERFEDPGKPLDRASPPRGVKMLRVFIAILVLVSISFAAFKSRDGDFARLQSQISELHSRQSNAESVIQNLEKDKSRLQSDIDKKENEFASLDKDKKELEEKYKKLWKGDQAGLMRQIEERNKSLESLGGDFMKLYEKHRLTIEPVKPVYPRK